MEKRNIPYYLIFGVAIVVFLLLLKNRKASPDDPCQRQKELFQKEITSGVISNKFIDKEDHAMKKVFIKSKVETYELLFIHYDNWADFDRINIGDSISKTSKSFYFTVNKQFNFQLKYECDYMKD